MKHFFLSLLVLVHVTAWAQQINPVYEVASASEFPTLTYEVVLYDGYPWKRTADSTGFVANGGTTLASNAGYHYERQFDGPVFVRWFGAKGDGVTDDTDAIQRAIDTHRSINFGPGTFMVRELHAKSDGAAIYAGEGSSFYTPNNSSSPQKTIGTTLKALMPGQKSIFTIGSQSMTIQNMRIDGDYKANCGIHNIQGTSFKLISCFITHTLEYGVYICNQGHASILNSDFAENRKVGLFLYNDSNLEGGGISQGTVPLWIGSGGNRISGVNPYQGSECNILIKANPECSTNHINNTHISNLYIDNPINPTSVPVVKIEGTPSLHVFDTQITNSHIGTAQENRQGQFQQGLNYTEKIAGGISLNYTERTLISNCTFLGNGYYATPTKYTDYWIKATNTSGLVVEGGLMQGSNRSAIHLYGVNDDVTINGVQFLDWGIKRGTITASGDDVAAIRQEGTIGSLLVGNSTFYVYDNETTKNHYAIRMNDASRLTLSGITLRYPSLKVVESTTGKFSGTYRFAGGENMKLQNVDAVSTIPSNANLGTESAYLNTTGTNLTALGFKSLRANTTGLNNTAIGAEALLSNTTGNDNVAIGYSSQLSGTTGGANTSIGNRSMYSVSSGYRNVAIGYDALFYNSSGFENTALGFEAGKTLTTGYFNILLGSKAGQALTTGSGNIFLGNNAGGTETTNSNLLYIGHDAPLLYGELLGSRLAIGHKSPSAILHLANGTATNAPLKFTAGTNVSTPEEGAMEFDGTNYYLTSGGVRRKIIVGLSGPTSSRPANPGVGMYYFDTTLKLPLWHSGNGWIDAMGNTR